jgi:hydroxypyruvate reductase
MDGIDGNSDAAGARVEGGAVKAGRSQGLDPERHLSENDSNRFLSLAGDLIVTGPTCTNVNDVSFALVSE